MNVPKDYLFRSHLREALTLIELLVSISVIGTLIGLLLPAVQVVRGQSHKISCQSNQKQLGLAAQHWESQFGSFPKGSSTHPRNSNALHRSWLIDLLPFIEQSNLAAVVEPILVAEVDTSKDIRGIEKNLLIKLFLCPSNSQTQTKDGAVNHYLGVSGLQLRDELGVLGINFAVKTAEITDGLTNTLLIMERPVGPETLCYAWYTPAYNCYSTSAQMGIFNYPNHMNGGTFFGPSPYKKWDPTHIGSGYGPWSYHSGGSNFALADGSVRFIRYSAGSILPAMATRAGGETFDMP